MKKEELIEEAEIIYRIANYLSCDLENKNSSLYHPKEKVLEKIYDKLIEIRRKSYEEGFLKGLNKEKE